MDPMVETPKREWGKKGALLGIPAFATIAMTNRGFVNAMVKWHSRKMGSEGKKTAFVRLMKEADEIIKDGQLNVEALLNPPQEQPAPAA